ncbi:MAG: AAA family ATPase [Planctomycetota bacterium]|nr:AAA family ATPase [Planctomycetota bacterium]
MRLAKLTLWGFKSFADRTEINFDVPVAGIVGPNGCGKSNVVDAIKWVLGEQSAKSLRGGAMMDVIFNGSSTRKPSGMASVTLTFENPIEPEGKRKLPLDSDIVAVTRQLYRDGSSEYLINKQRARLRDIRELFMDTGIGTDAYSIIEQGKVDVMLQSNAQERREIFEEAAGISRFKARKKESLRKLESRPSPTRRSSGSRSRPRPRTSTASGCSSRPPATRPPSAGSSPTPPSPTCSGRSSATRSAPRNWPSGARASRRSSPSSRPRSSASPPSSRRSPPASSRPRRATARSSTRSTRSAAPSRTSGPASSA